MKKTSKKLKIFIAVCLALAVLYVAEGAVSNTMLSVSKYTVEFEELPLPFDGFKIAQISDLHNAELGKNNERLIAAIDAEAPDIVVLTGDMVNYGDVEFELIYSLLGSLTQKYDVYYILGNHEQTLRVANMCRLCDEAEKLGVNLLFNQSVEIKKDGGSFMLHGLCQYKESYRDPYYSQPSQYEFSVEKMEELLGKSSDTLLDVVLAHNPMYFDIYSDWGADLTLSGHIHGGLWRIPFGKGIFSPNQELFPKYDAGEYELDGRHLIVSRGLGGGNIIKPRLFNRPDLVMITLAASNPNM